MSTEYTLSNYTTRVLPNGLHKDAGVLAHAALAVGWKLYVKGIMIRLVSPDGSATITITASNKNIPWERYRRLIQKHANPLLLPKDGKPETGEAILDRIEHAHRQAEAKEVSAPETPALTGDGAARTVVSEAPMLAHRGQGKGYPSVTTNERKWSDGSIDYTCRSEGCDFASLDRRGVGPHWRSHVSRGEEQPAGVPTMTVDTPPHEPAYTKDGYTPRRERVSALAAVLAALDLAAMSAEELAEFVLNWQNTQSAEGGRLAAEREEMTSDDVLNRIRTLLDNGTYLRQQEEISTLRAEMNQLAEDCAEAQQEAQAAKERWDTLRSLMEDDA